MNNRHPDIFAVTARGGAVGDREVDDALLSCMWRWIAEYKTAADQSRETIILTKGGIALLDRLQGPQISD